MDFKASTLLDILLMVDQEKFWDIELGQLADYSTPVPLAAARPEKLGLHLNVWAWTSVKVHLATAQTDGVESL